MLLDKRVTKERMTEVSKEIMELCSRVGIYGDARKGGGVANIATWQGRTDGTEMAWTQSSKADDNFA